MAPEVKQAAILKGPQWVWHTFSVLEGTPISEIKRHIEAGFGLGRLEVEFRHLPQVASKTRALVRPLEGLVGQPGFTYRVKAEVEAKPGWVLLQCPSCARLATMREQGPARDGDELAMACRGCGETYTW